MFIFILNQGGMHFGLGQRSYVVAKFSSFAKSLKRDKILKSNISELVKPIFSCKVSYESIFYVECAQTNHMTDFCFYPVNNMLLTKINIFT